MSRAKYSAIYSGAELILQPFRHFTYVTAHSTTLPSLYLRHSSFSSPSVASPTSQFILQPFFRFSYVTSSSLNSHGARKPIYKMSRAQSPTFPSLLLRHNSFSNPSFASPTSQALHLIHLASHTFSGLRYEFVCKLLCCVDVENYYLL